jgi:hypothetical protein
MYGLKHILNYKIICAKFKRVMSVPCTIVYYITVLKLNMCVQGYWFLMSF